MEEIAEDITRNWAVNMNNLPPPKWEPTPLALALCDGLPTLRQLRVTNREPELWWAGRAAWYRDSQPWTPRPTIELPGPIFDSLAGGHLDESGQARSYPTPDAAKDALASGAWEWVAGFKRS